MKLNITNNKTTGDSSAFSSFIKIFVLLVLFKTINSKSTTTTKITYILTNKIPDDIESVFKGLIDPKSKECINEISLIYKKDYKDGSINPYKVLSLDKFLNRTIIQVTKKLNKYTLFETKNFTGIRWINPKLYTGEIKKLLESHFQHLTEYFEKTYFNCKNTVPEFILENYLYFFEKYNEIKKSTLKFYLLKGIKKFTKCMSKTNNSYMPINFGQNLMNGKMTVKLMLTHLKNMLSALNDIITANNIENFARGLKKFILNVRGIPTL